MRKKIIAVFLAVFLVALSAAPAANAATSPVVSLPTVDAAPGETFTVDLSISGNSGIAAMVVTLIYDKTVLNLVKAKNGTVFDGFSSGANLTFDGEDGANTFADGVIATCTFEVLEDAAAGTYPISIKIRECCDEEWEDVACSVSNGSVRVVTEAQTAAILDTASLSLLDAIGVNFYTILPDAVKNDAGAYALFDGPNGEQTVFVKDAATGADGRTVFTYAVYAKETRDEINLRLFDGTGAQIDMVCGDAAHTPISAEGYSYSVDTYLAAIAAGGESDEMKALAAALADYGAAADRLFGYSGANAPAVEADLSEITAESLDAYKLTQSGTAPEGLSLSGATLMLESETTLRVYFKAQTAPAVTVDGAAVDPVQKGNAYYVAIPNILAKELGAPHTIAFGEYGISCSALTYAYSVLRAYPESDTSAEAVNLRTLARALVRYQQTAVAYFESK